MKQYQYFFLLFLLETIASCCTQNCDNSPCQAPTGFIATNITSTSLTVEWQLSNAQKYLLRASDSLGTIIQIDTVLSPTQAWTVTGLQSGKLYIIDLQAICTVCNEECLSDMQSLQMRTADGGGVIVVIEDNIDAYAGNGCTPTTIYQSGDIALPINIRPTCRFLNWQNPNHCSFFIIAYRSNPMFTPPYVGTCINPSSPSYWFCRILTVKREVNNISYALTGLCPNTNYSIRVWGWTQKPSCLSSNSFIWADSDICD